MRPPALPSQVSSLHLFADMSQNRLSDQARHALAVHDRAVENPISQHGSCVSPVSKKIIYTPVSYTHLRAHETDSYLV